MSAEEKPLRIQVAEVLGYRWWRSAQTGRRCLYAPGRNPEWMQTPADGTEEIVRDTPDGAFCPFFDTNWSHGGPLIGRFKISIGYTNDGGAFAGHRKVGTQDQLPGEADVLPAVCRVILALAKAGKLEGR